MHGEVLTEQQDGQPVSRLVGIDLGIASRHSVRALEADGRVVCRSSCVPTVESLALVEQAALAGARSLARVYVTDEHRERERVHVVPNSRIPASRSRPSMRAPDTPD